MQKFSKSFIQEQASGSNKDEIRLGKSYELGGKLGNAVESIGELVNTKWYYNEKESVLIGYFPMQRGATRDLSKKTLKSIIELPNFIGISVDGNNLTIDIGVRSEKDLKNLIDSSFFDGNGNLIL